MWHRIMHWLGWNTGTVVSALDAGGTVWIGFKCGQCGEVSGIHASYCAQCRKITSIHRSYAEQPNASEFH